MPYCVHCRAWWQLHPVPVLHVSSAALDGYRATDLGLRNRMALITQQAFFVEKLLNTTPKI